MDRAEHLIWSKKERFSLKVMRTPQLVVDAAFHACHVGLISCISADDVAPLQLHAYYSKAPRDYLWQAFNCT